MTQKRWKMTETLAYGYSSEGAQWELSNEYQHDRVQMVFKNLCILVLWTKIASALKGLNIKEVKDHLKHSEHERVKSIFGINSDWDTSVASPWQWSSPIILIANPCTRVRAVFHIVITNSGWPAIPGKSYNTIMIEIYAQFIPFLRLATRLCYLAPSLALQSLVIFTTGLVLS